MNEEKIKKETSNNKQIKIFEKNQEEIKYRKAKLLLGAVVKRRIHAKINKFVRSDHNCTGLILIY